MPKILRQNVGGVDYTMAGCALTATCATSASDYVKDVVLSDGDVLSDGMTVVVNFTNGNTAGTAPETLTIYSSDQTNYYSDPELTQPFTLAPQGCYSIEYTGTGNAYSYISYPVVQIGNVQGALCYADGSYAGGTLWNAGDLVSILYTNGRYIIPDSAVDIVQAGNMKPVTSNAVFNLTGTKINTSKTDANLCYADSTRVEFFRLTTGSDNCPPSNVNDPTIIQAFTYNDGNYLRVTQTAYDNYSGVASYIRSGYGTVGNVINWSSWQPLTPTDSVAYGITSPVTGNAVFNYVNRLDIKVPRPTQQFSKVTVALNALEPYITTLVALMTRGCGLCLVGLSGQDSGTKPSIIKYLSNVGQYNSYFYYRDINNINKIEFYWTGSAYSTRDSIAILTNAQNVTIEEVSYVSTLPSDVVVL